MRILLIARSPSKGSTSLQGSRPAQKLQVSRCCKCVRMCAAGGRARCNRRMVGVEYPIIIPQEKGAAKSPKIRQTSFTRDGACLRRVGTLAHAAAALPKVVSGD